MASKPTQPPLDLSELLISWKQVLRAQNKAKSTQYNYAAHVEGFIKWCEARGETPRINRALVTDWVAELLGSGLEASTVKARLLGMRRISAWMSEENTIDYTDELLGFPAVTQSEKLIQPLSDKELKLMIAACDGKALRDRRDEAVIRLLAETGMRVGEALGLHLQDVNMATGTVAIRKTKTGRGRVVNFEGKTGVALDRYLRLRRGHPLAHHPQLFLGERGHGLGYMGLRSSILYRAELAGVKGFHPHLLRHTAASRWLSAGGSEQGLMQRAGWRSRQMVDRYTRATAQERSMDEARKLNLGDL